MKQLNADYRGINKVTDVLSFETALPVQHDGGAILGDVVINIPRAESQAKEYGTTFYEELFRLLIHGTLHLLGYDHEESYYRARKMRNKEEELLSKCL
jgi:probable rRNA maturation factor